MKRITIALMLVAGVACSTRPSDWDAQATSSLKAEVDRMLHTIDTGNFADLISRLDADATVFDIDDKNQPVPATGRDQMTQYMKQMESAMKTQGLKFASSLKSNECHASQNMGFCAFEFTQTVTTGGQTMGPFKFRGTLIARKAGDAWSWVHWHGSFAEFPKGA